MPSRRTDAARGNWILSSTCHGGILKLRLVKSLAFQAGQPRNTGRVAFQKNSGNREPAGLLKQPAVTQYEHCSTLALQLQLHLPILR